MVWSRAVVAGDGAVAIGVAGRRRVESDDFVELGDLWHLGSDIKAMTATVAAIVVEDGAYDVPRPAPRRLPRGVAEGLRGTAFDSAGTCA
ncbi:MAG: hypothetical protein MUE69_07570 [Myxococcota bacterium]|jgi:hypothetical protein|nr:hypothetical protein [Myxococcota bacterium]